MIYKGEPEAPAERISSCCSAPLIHDERGDDVAMCARCKEWCEPVGTECDK